jgi:DNA-binding PadR family transcriptional regulator
VRRANVYTTLQRLEAKRLVTTKLGDARAERGGKPRRLVVVRPAGVAAVRATAGAIQAMVGDLGGMLGELG